MTMLKQGSVLTLNDDKKYSVVYSINLENVDYVYLVDQDDYNNNMFCKYLDNQLERVSDSELIKKLLLEVNK